MTTIAEHTLTDALQTLVDARLDTIDRMLLGRVNRQDRLAIVREVESQVFDLLRRHDGPLDRDDVLAVLARLDPPEAYLPEDDSPAEARPRWIATVPRAASLSRDAQPSWLGLTGGVVGIVSVTILLLGASIGIALQSLVVYFGAIALVVIGGLLAIVFAARARLRGAWSLVGLVTGILSLLLSVLAGLFA